MFLERRRNLSRNITNLHVPQRLYIPGSKPLLNVIDPILLADSPESVELWLPLALPPASRDAQCIEDLPQLKYRMRYAQAMSALHDIRRFCRLIRAFTVKTQSHISNTQGTRTQGLFGGVKAKQARAVSTYRAAWNAIVSLAPNEEFGHWKDTLFELKNDDICGPGHNESERSESRYVQSWIWTTPQSGTSIEDLNPNDPNLHVAVWIEWCKAQE